jgi:hypothetical protein
MKYGKSTATEKKKSPDTKSTKPKMDVVAKGKQLEKITFDAKRKPLVYAKPVMTLTKSYKTISKPKKK